MLEAHRGGGDGREIFGEHDTDFVHHSRPAAKRGPAIHDDRSRQRRFLRSEPGDEVGDGDLMTEHTSVAQDTSDYVVHAGCEMGDGREIRLGREAGADAVLAPFIALESRTRRHVAGEIRLNSGRQRAERWA